MDTLKTRGGANNFHYHYNAKYSDSVILIPEQFFIFSV